MSPLQSISGSKPPVETTGVVGENKPLHQMQMAQCASPSAFGFGFANGTSGMA